MIRKLSGHFIILISTCLVAGMFYYFGNILLLSFITVKTGSHYLYRSNLITCILHAGTVISIIYLGWRLGLACINYALQPHLSVKRKLLLNIILASISCLITLMIFGAMGGGFSMQPAVVKNIVIIVVASISIPLTEAYFKL